MTGNHQIRRKEDAMKNRTLALAGLMLALTLATAPQKAAAYTITPQLNNAGQIPVALDATPAPDFWSALLSAIGSIL
jgi:predicted Zn-dependent protease